MLSVMESHALIAHILILRNSTLITQCARMFWTFERIFQRKVERQSKYVAGNNTFLTSANNGDCTVYLTDCIFLRTHLNAILNDVRTALLREHNHILVLIKIL